MNKVVIITGASGNLGEVTVKKFVEEGYQVVVTVSPGRTLGFYEDHPNVAIFNVDLTDESGVGKFVQETVNKYKTIDAALLLVGGFAMGDITKTSGEDIRKMYSLNFETAYFVARPVFDQMMKQKSGRLIFIGSRPAIKATDGKKMVAYGLAKSLLFKLSEYLNAEGSSSNVTSTVIVPSTLDTPANRKGMPDADFSAWVKPEEIAETMAFIVSEKASALRETVLKFYGKA